MTQIGDVERKTQSRVVKLFKDKLKYDYLGSWEDEEDNNCIEEEYLRKYLTERKYSETLINKALFELRRAAEDQNKSLYDINKEVYSYLRYGVKVKEDISENTKTVELIDWKEPHKNHFAIAEEVTVKGQNEKRPDIVLYVNGIALGVLELKRSTISVSEGIRQNLDNQKPVFIKNFFATIQLVMAGNDTEGLRYGVIETHEKYYLKWKEDSDVENPLDKHLLNIFQKERLLELIHDYIVFDCGIKKICRHYQYFGIKEAQKFLARREGGIIWHTQGSGKSLTMIWLAKWIRENITNSRVLIITDRDELDKQIEGKFIGVNEEIYRTKPQDGKSGGRVLIEKLNTTTPWLICSLIHKFGRKEEADYDEFIEDLNKFLPKDFYPKGDFYLFVDECHRTQSGKLHKAMKSILPNAIIIGFTGTPLIKTDKQKSTEVFGGYIHKYRFDEGVADKVICDLQYEARKVDQNITSQDKIDQWFDAKTKGLTPYAKTELKKRWATMQSILSSQGRLEKIVADIMLDMETKDRLKSGYGNAMLIAGSIYEACKYYQLFQEHGLKKCAIITSYNATISQIKGEAIGDDEETENIFKYDVYQKMLNGKSVESFEEEVKNKFIHEPAQMKLLIVVDKLLAGFDAAPATYLYIDKSMQDHGLFQAVCRVNRLDTDDKEYGYIIDYKDLFNSLQESFKDYTSAAFDSYDKEDVAGLLNDRLKKAKEHLDESLENIHALCDPVEPAKDSNAFRKYFVGKESGNIDELKENEQKRITLYKLTAILIRAYASIANEMIEAGYTEKEIENIKQKVKYYEQVRQEVKLSSGDYIDLKAYEPAMRHLIDTYISAEESKVISAFDDLTLVDMLVERGAEAVSSLPKHISQNKKAVAETIENNVRRLIIDEMPTNPKYFESMSVLLDELIKQRNQETLDYEEYLSKIIDLSKKVKNPNPSYPPFLNTKAKRALYDNLNMNEPLAILLDNDLHMRKPADFRGNKIKERVVKNIVRENLEKYGISEENEVDKIFELIKNQNEY
jgi:type I restriction enzyme R subunit